jgi:hypothetical protein
MAERTRDSESGPAAVGDIAQSSVWTRLNVSGLEADLAYFRARLELIGAPQTINQKAQQEAFRLLTQAVGAILNRLRRRSGENP